MTQSAHHISVASNVTIGSDLPFVLLAGPCAMESRQHAFDMCGALVDMTNKLGIPFVFKSSFDKANRTSIHSPRGIGIDTALQVFADLKSEYNVPVVTDVHTPEHCQQASSVVDILQIPAFLCRQTDLVVAAAKTGCVLNIKKGQFLAPWDMKNVIQKAIESGNERVMLCERGASFGYNTLVSDMRSLPIMAQTGYPVIFDATHSVQQPGGQGATSGGQREFVPVLARASLAVGVAGVFMETHDNPDESFSDGPNMVPLSEMADVLAVMKEIDTIAKKHPLTLPQ